MLVMIIIAEKVKENKSKMIFFSRFEEEFFKSLWFKFFICLALALPVLKQIMLKGKRYLLEVENFQHRIKLPYQ